MSLKNIANKIDSTKMNYWVNITNIFANLDGCIEKGPTVNQLLAPFLAFVNNTAISNIIDIP